MSDRVFFIETHYKIKRHVVGALNNLDISNEDQLIQVRKKPASEFRNRVRSVPAFHGHGGFSTVFRSVYFYPPCNSAIDVPD